MTAAAMPGPPTRRSGASSRLAGRGPLGPIAPFSFSAGSMGGTLRIHLAGVPDGAAQAQRDAARVIARIDRWAGRLTRHGTDSELIRLNAAAAAKVPIGPTLAAALEAALEAGEISGGLADVTLLEARLAAEEDEAPDMRAARPSRAAEWSLHRTRRGRAVVRRPPGLRFDLGGVGKGWIADRALRLLVAWPSAAVDADGDVALRAAPGAHWEVAVDDPRAPGEVLAILRLGAPAAALPVSWGVATSGTSVHRWPPIGQGSAPLAGEAPIPVRHHLIDPRTGRPAITDLVQATVVTSSAIRSEALAKATVIAGSEAGLALLERARVAGAVVLTESGEALALPSTLPLLAA